MKIYDIGIRFHWSLFLRVNEQYSSTGSDNAFAPLRWKATVWSDDVYGCIYASLDLNELNWYYVEYTRNYINMVKVKSGQR